jgi:hypothetical protein
MGLANRRAIEDLMLRLSIAPAQQPEPQQSGPFPSASSIPLKLVYSIKEVRELLAISNSSIYKEIGEGRFRAVKRGNRTMILASILRIGLADGLYRDHQESLFRPVPKRPLVGAGYQSRCIRY